MSFIEKVVLIQTSDTELYQCPATQTGSAHGLVFTNTTNVDQFITIKLFTFLTGLTTPITSANQKIPANGQFTWPKPINLNTGDKIIAVANNSSSVTALVSIYISTAQNATVPFSPRGDWSSIAQYNVNDIVTYQGNSYIAIAQSSGSQPPGTGWMILAAKGDVGSITNNGAFATNIVLNGGNIVMTGNETVDGRDVSADGMVIDAVSSSNGLVVSTGSNTFAHRTLTGTPSEIVVSNGDGTTGNPTLSFPNFVQFPGVAGLGIPSGTSAQRDSNPVFGELRFNTDTNFVEAYIGGWEAIVFDNDGRLNHSKIKVVRVNPGKGEFSSIAAAMDSITDASSSNPYLIDVGPGVFVEPTINYKSYITIRGAGMDDTIIQAQTPNMFLIECRERGGMESCTVTGATAPGYAAFHMINSTGDTNTTFNIDKVRFGSNCIHVLVEKGYVSINSALWGSTFFFDYGFIAKGLDNNTNARIIIRNSTSTGILGGLQNESPQCMFRADGPKSLINLLSIGARYSGVNIDTNSVGLHLRNGATCLVFSLHIERWGKGFWVENTGSAPAISLQGCNLQRNILDLVIDHPSTTGNFNGNASRANSSVANGVTATIFYNDLINQGVVNIGPIYLGNTHSNLVNVTELITKTPTLGVLSGGALSPASGLFVNVAAGIGYTNLNGNVTKISWSGTVLSVGPGSHNFIYVNNNGIISQSVSEPDETSNILLGQYLANGTSVLFTNNASTNINNFGNSIDKFNRIALGPIFVSGSNVGMNVTNHLSLDVSAGHYFCSTTELFPAAKNNITFHDTYFLNGIQTVVPTTIVDNVHYCDGTNLIPLSAGQYTKHVLYSIGDGANVQFVMAHGTASYATLVQAEQAPIPTTPLVPSSSPYIAAIIVQQGNSSIVEIIDLRPRIGFAAPTSSASSVHGNLLGLTADDHTQYLLVSGARAMSGNLNMGTNNIINSGTVNGVTVEAHEARHIPGGADALPTATASGLNLSSTNTEGTASSFARSDHTHALTGIQSQANQLDSISGITSTGLVSMTGASGASAAAVSIVGTTGQIVVSNGDGVAGNPTLSLSNDIVLPGTDAITLPTGTTAQRPTSPLDGSIRYNSDTGLTEFFQGTVSWQSFVLDNDLRINGVQTLRVRQSPGKGQYSSISAAMAAITDATSTKPYLIDVGPGIFTEPTINAKQYVQIRGSGVDITVIQPQSASQFLIECVERGSLSHATITGCTATGYAALHMVNSTGDTNTTYNVDNVRFGTNHMHGLCEKGYVSINNCYWGSNFYFDHGFVAKGLDSTTNARFLIRNCTSTGILGGIHQTAPQHMYWANGPKSLINVLWCASRNSTAAIDPNMTAMRVSNGATTLIYASHFERWGKGIWTENTGAAPTIQVIGASCINNTYDLYLDHPGTLGSFSGIATRSHCHVDDNVMATIFYTDLNNQGIVNIGPIYSGRNHTNLTDIAPLITEGFQLGVLTGGTVTNGTGLTVNVGNGTGYLRVINDLRKISWVDTVVTVPTNSTGFIYIDVTGTFNTSTATPDSFANIIIGKFLTDATHTIFCSQQGSINIPNFSPNIDRMNKYAVGPLYVSGSVVSENATTPRAIDISDGFYFYSAEERHPVAVTATPILCAYHSGGANVLTTVTQIDNTKYDNGTDLVNLTAGYFNTFTIYGTGTGATAGYFMQYGQGNYPTLDAAKAAGTPPSYIPTEGKPPIATIIVQQGTTNIVAIIDVRPRLNHAGASAAGVTRHGDLTGLLNDDHSQYLLASGTRAMSGGLNMNSNAITNVASVNTVVVEAHATRHLPNGADPLTTAAPSTTLSLTTTNAVGVANSLARSDHTHAITGVQPASVDLSAIAGITSNGLIRRTSSGAWTGGSSVSLSSEVTGNLSTSNLNSGTNASSTTFWRGDGSWAVPAPASITISGDVTGSGTTAIALTLANSGVTAGTYNGLSIDSKGRVTSVTLPTTLSGYGITNAVVNAGNTPSVQTGLDASKPIAGTLGRVYHATDTNSIYVDNGTAWILMRPAVSGDVTIPNGSSTATLATTGVAAGTYKSVQVDTKGRVVAGATPTTLAGYTITDAVSNGGNASSLQANVFASRPAAGTLGRIYLATDTNALYYDNGTTWLLMRPAITGDISISAGGTVATLPTVNSSVGTFNNVAVNGKGLVTNAFNVSYVTSSLVGAANGVASLDSSGKLPASQLTSAVVGAVVYQGTWNASTNTPTLVSSTGTKGQYYKVSVAGNTAIDGNAQWNIGDTIIFDGTTWDKLDGVSSEVISVAGRTGAVVLTTTDVSEGSNLYYTNARASAAAPVQSVAGRTGAVTLAVADVTGAAPLASPALTGTPTAPTATTSDSSTTIATTAFVKAQSYITSAGAPVQSVAGRTGAVVLTSSDVSGVATSGANSNITSLTGLTTALSVLQGGTGVTTSTGTGSNVLSASPALTGIPTAPTATTSDSSTTIATTAFVKAQSYITSAGAPVQSVAGRTGAITLAQADIAGLTTSSSPTFSAVTATTFTGALSGNATTVSSITSNQVTTALGFTPVNNALVGAASGIATLDGSGKLPASQLTASVVGAVVYQGTWNASTNTPTLVSGTGTKGNYYKVSVTGATSIDGNTQWNAGDVIIFDGTTWDKIDGISSEVLSVAGRTGNVVLTTNDIAEGTNLYYTNARASAAAPVQSVAGRTGAIVLTSSDVSEGTNLYFTNARASSAAPVQSVAGRTGAVTLAVADVTGAAPLASPALTGTPTAPTASTADSSTTVATTAFVKAQSYITSSGAPVQSVAGRTGAVVLTSTDVGLNNLSNNLQVINAGGAVSVQAGTLASRPSAGTAGHIYIANDTGVMYIDNGTTWITSSLQNFQGNISQTSGTTTISYGTSAPTIASGTQIMSQVITPLSTSSKIQLTFSGQVDTSSTSQLVVTVAVFRGATCVGYASTFVLSTYPANINLNIVDSPATTSATTYTMRIGISAAATWYLGRGQTATMGGISNAGWSIKEVI